MTSRKLARRPSATEGPLYRQMVAILKQEILRGAHPVGSTLPSENELCRRFRVSPQTVGGRK